MIDGEPAHTPNHPHTQPECKAACTHVFTRSHTQRPTGRDNYMALQDHSGAVESSSCPSSAATLTGCPPETPPSPTAVSAMVTCGSAHTRAVRAPSSAITHPTGGSSQPHRTQPQRGVPSTTKRRPGTPTRTHTACCGYSEPASFCHMHIPAPALSPPNTTPNTADSLARIKRPPSSCSLALTLLPSLG